MDTFGEWLREQRSLRRLTREELARRVGCSPSMLRKIEYGERRPSAQIAGLIADCLDIAAGERSTFVRVARGELRVDRLLPQGAPPADLPASKNNLPVFPNPLIGRRHELEQLGQLLRDPQCRLLTLVGPGGIGKTRLAIETASQLQDSFSDGVHFIPLASCSSTRYIVPVIADAIGFAFQSAGHADPKTLLFRHLREEQALLLADNLEQLLVEPGIELLAELLAHAPQVKLLATSRECLGLQEEWVFEVQGLPYPEELSAGAQNTSVDLFLQRARRAHVGFSVAPEDHPAIVRICRLVDGNPLGIELAAAWVRTLSCEEVAGEIEHGMDFLSVSVRDLPARHRSMRAVFDHSWRLLTEEEQRALIKLSRFQGGFRREAAEQVAEAELPVLSALVTKSLVRRSPTGRFDLHELILKFAAEKLAEKPEEQTATRARHGRYYLEYLSRADPRLRSSALRETLTELTAEMDNLRAAWDWAIAHHEITRLCRASQTLRYLYELRGWFEEGEAVFLEAAEAIASHPGESHPDEGQHFIHAMRAHSAYFSFRLGRSTVTEAALLSSAAALQSSPDPSAAPYTMWYLGIVYWASGRFTEAIDTLRVGLATAREHGEHWYEAALGEYIGIVLHEQGEYEQARPYFVEALAIARRVGDPMQIAHVLAYMSRTILTLGRFDEAEAVLRESLALAQEIGYSSYLGHALDGLGRLAQVTRSEDARALFAASYEAYKESGDARNMARVLSHQGYDSLARGDESDAQDSFIGVLRLVHEGGFLPFALDALAGLAAVQAKQGDTEHALELLLMVLNDSASLQETRDRASNLRADLEGELSPAQVELIQARLGEKSFEAVVEELLT